MDDDVELDGFGSPSEVATVAGGNPAAGRGDEGWAAADGTMEAGGEGWPLVAAAAAALCLVHCLLAALFLGTGHVAAGGATFGLALVAAALFGHAMREGGA